MGNVYEDHKHHVLNMVMIVVFIVFFGIGMYLLSQRSAGLYPQNNKDVTMKNTDQGTDAQADSARLMLANAGKSTYEVGDEIILTVAADSNGSDINGFDALLGYDPEKLEVVSAESAKKEFQLFTFKNPTYLSLTATKLLTVNAPAVFTGDILITVKMKAKASGKTSVELMGIQGHEKSKLVDNKAEIIIPALNAIELEIQ